MGEDISAFGESLHLIKIFPNIGQALVSANCFSEEANKLYNTKKFDPDQVWGGFLSSCILCVGLSSVGENVVKRVHLHFGWEDRMYSQKLNC